MEYLVCVLDDEHYTSPDFDVCKTLDEAKEVSREFCEEFAKYHKDDEPEYDETEMRLDVKTGEYQGGHYVDRFLVTEIKEVNGDYALVEHHAYDGVDFEVKCCGTYEECEEKRKEWVKNCQYEFDTEDEDDTYDTGVEWIHISLVKIKED